MKALYYTQTLPPAGLSGSEKYVRELSATLSHSCENITLVGTNKLGYLKFHKPDEWASGNIHYIRVKVNPILESAILPMRVIALRNDRVLRFTYEWKDGLFHSILKGGHYSRSFRRLRFVHDFDIVHGVAFPTFPLWSAWKKASEYRLPLVVTPFLHYAAIDDSCPSWMFKALTFASAVIAVTNSEKQFMVKHNICKEKIRVVPLGIRLGDWENVDREESRKFLGLDEEVAILIPNKSFDKGCYDVLQALSTINLAGKKIVVIMMGAVDAMNERVLKLHYFKLQNRGIRIIDVGYVSELKKMMMFKAADILAQPSKSDSFGYVYLESWACKMPVIGANVGAIPDVISDNRNGMIVEFNKPEILREILEMLIEDRDLRKRLGSTGYSEVVKNNNLDTIALRTMDIYKEVCNDP